MLKGLHHVGIAVADINSAVELYTGALAASVMRLGSNDDVDFALLDSGGVELELLQARDADSAIGKFVAERGPGLHHLAYGVDDIHSAIVELTARGLQQSGEVRVGLHGGPIVFFHPKSVGGVLTELVQVGPK